MNAGKGSLDYRLPPAPYKAVASISFEDAVERYHGRVFQVIYRYVGDYDEAGDLTQDTFMRAYNAWGQFRGESQIYTWLYRIAINVCNNYQLREQRRRRREALYLDAPREALEEAGCASGCSYEVVDDRPLPLQVLESSELCARLQEALQELPDNQRTAIILREIEGLSYEEIARATGYSLKATKSRLFRARNALRRLLEPYLESHLLAERAAPRVPKEQRHAKPAKDHPVFVV
jgi:RNA polymerase sigma-70 factor (ECF subfamily)